MFPISSWVPFCSVLQHTQALGQTAPSLSKPSAHTPQAQRAENKWSRMPPDYSLANKSKCGTRKSLGHRNNANPCPSEKMGAGRTEGKSEQYLYYTLEENKVPLILKIIF